MENAGYEIIKTEVYNSRVCGDGFTRADGIALGKSKTMYVTWEYTAREGEETNFYWGHYYESRVQALEDYHKRLMDKYNAMPF